MKASLLHVCLIIFCCYFVTKTDGLGTSILGIDYGTDTFKVMVLRGSSPDIVLNDQSGRKTHTLVGFDISGERLFGSAAAQLKSKHPDRVISSAHEFLGKRYPDSFIEEHKHLFPFQIVNNNGTYGFQIDERVYSPEEIVGMTIEYAANMAFKSTGSKPTDCAIVVPPYLTQLERQGFINAASIVGLNVITLAHEGSSAAVQYLRTRLLGEENLKQHTIFFNVGAGHTSATLARFNIQKPEKSKKQQISRKIYTNITTWEQVGGRDFDHELTQFLLQKAEEQLGQQLSSNARVVQRLSAAARKAKEVLSANREAHVRIESLSGDFDFQTVVTREEFEIMCSHLFERVMKPIRDIIENSAIPVEELDIEVIGGGSRVLKINDYLQEIFTEARVGRHLNGDEASLAGAMLHAATGTSGKRSAFTVRDNLNRNVWISCNTSDFEDNYHFTSNSFLGGSKSVFVATDAPFRCTFTYEEESLSTGIPREINSYEIENFPDLSGLTLADPETKPQVKVRCGVDKRGLIDCTEAFLNVSVIIERVEIPPVVLPQENQPLQDNSTETVEIPPVETQDNEAQDGEAQEGDAQEHEAPEGDAQEEEAPEEEVQGEEGEEINGGEEGAENVAEDSVEEGSESGEEVVEEVVEEAEKEEIQYRQFVLTVTKVPNSNELDWDTLNEASLFLLELNKQDRERALLAETKNELESYIYATLEFLDTDGAREVSTSEERESFSELLLEAGDWLYDDGYDAKLEQYQEKLSSLRDIGDRISFRLSESELRPLIVAAFQEWKDNTVAALENIVVERTVDDEDREVFLLEIKEVESWLEAKQEEQAGVEPFVEPVWISSELIEKQKILDNKMKRLLRRPKRTPTPTPTPSPSPSTEDVENFANIEFASFDEPTEEVIVDQEINNTEEHEQKDRIHEEL